MYIYPGAIHIHTTFSDGTATIEEVIRYAKCAGLKWIIITDHNDISSKRYEGWHDGLLVLSGEEISPENSNHYLALDVKEKISPDLKPEEVIQEVKKQGGIGFIAHPDESLNRKHDHKSLRWENWDIKGFDGLEIWNFLSDWTDNYEPQKALYHYFFRNKILTGPTKNVLKWWDKLNLESEHIIPAIGGVDAHALNKKYFGINIKVFPYIDSFKTITNFVYLNEALPEDFQQAKSQILQAIKQGSNVIANRNWQNIKYSPIFYVKSAENIAFAGEEIKLEENAKLIFKAPKKVKIRLIYDGQLVWEDYNKELVFEALDKGKYRIEAYYKNYPYIFTNYIKVA